VATRARAHPRPMSMFPSNCRKLNQGRSRFKLRMEGEMDSHRSRRVSEALREELGELIAYELSDPRIGDAVVTEVLVSPDLRHAQVRLHFSDQAKDGGETIRALEGARHFLRHQLSERLTMFRIPELHFEPDIAGAEKGRMNHLFKRIRRGRPRDGEGEKQQEP
jgi:ribosome-binding factor A